MAFSLPDFNVGMGVEAEIITSDTGSSQLILMKDDNNYMISASPKWEKKRLIITSKIESVWGEKVTIDNFDYPKGESMTIRIEAHTSSFNVYVNNVLVNKFPHVMPLTDIAKTKFFGEEGQLKKYTVLFQPVAIS